jgi:AAA domain/RepB DNA-primase from phage plasmid
LYTNDTAASSGTVANATKFDRDIIEQHFTYLHHAAERAKVPGKLVLAVYGEDPDTRERFAEVRHFQVGAQAAMTAAAMEFDGVPHRNIYAPLAVMRPDLEAGRKGGEGDVVFSLALVIDGDADKGKDRPTSPVPADYIVESSFGNVQEFLFLDRPLPSAEAKPLARALQRATGAEFADDISHVWRVPGTLNWPNATKLGRGRSREPQPVRILKPWEEWTSTEDLRKVLAAHWQEPRAEPLAPRGTFDLCPNKVRNFHERLRDTGYYDREHDDPETTRKRWIGAAKALSYDLGDEGRAIFDEVVCWKGERQDEGLAVDSSEAEYRWRECSRLRSGVEPKTHGSLIDEAKRLYGWKGEQIHLERDPLEGGMLKGVTLAPGSGMGTAPASGTSVQQAAVAPRYLFETVSDLRLMPPQTWLVDRWIPDRSVGIIYGRFASGKSFIAFDLLLHLVYGMEDWHGVTLPGIPCCGLLIAREGGTGFQRRVDAFKKHHNITDDTDRMVFMRSPVNFGDTSQFAELKTAIETCGRQFKAVVVDTVGRALPGEDMFDPKSITRFMEHLQQIGEISQGVSIGIHHENKAGDVMGSIYFDNNSDFMFHVEREGDPAQGPLRRGKITCVKQKDGEDGWARDVSYKFVDTDPNGEGSLVIDSISGSSAPSKVVTKLTPKEGLALTALSDVLKAKGQLGGDIGGRSVTLDEWLDGCFSNGSISRDAARPNRDLHDRQVGLLTKGRILVLDNRVRLVGEGVKGEAGNVIPMATLPSNAVPMPPVTMSMPIPRRPS